MEKIYSLNNYIQSVTTGIFTDEGIITLKNNNKIFKVDSKKLGKIIATYFTILDSYPNLKDIPWDEDIYHTLLNDLKLYRENNLVNIKLDNKLQEKIDSYSKQELNLELNKYYQNSLTNKEVIKYIKKVRDEKDYYFYDKYEKYTQKECEEEIKTLKHIFSLLEKETYKENILGIKEKYLSFKPGSYEYENITPFICLDIYDLNHYQRVLKLLEKKIFK